MGGLPEAATAHYREHGYYAPIRVMPVAEAERLRRCLEAHEKLHGVLKGSMRHKSHLLFTWLDGLIRHPAILDAVEGVIGPDILCWSSTFFIKEARDPGFVSGTRTRPIGGSIRPISSRPGSRFPKVRPRTARCASFP